MEITKIMKIFSSEMRLKFLAHFYSCKCRKHSVNDLVDKFGTTQANISKHLILMETNGVLDYSLKHKTKYYWLSEEFKTQYIDLLKVILSGDKIKQYFCSCSNQKTCNSSKKSSKTD